MSCVYCFCHHISSLVYHHAKPNKNSYHQIGHCVVYGQSDIPQRCKIRVIYISLLSNSKSQSDSLDQQVALTALLKPLKLSVYLDKPVKSKTVLIYIFTLLISQSTNVEVNPGPVVSQYPCGHCNLEVTWSQKGIYCEECGIWYHTDCQGIGDRTYDKLSESKLIRVFADLSVAFLF